LAASYLGSGDQGIAKLSIVILFQSPAEKMGLYSITRINYEAGVNETNANQFGPINYSAG